MEHTGILKVVRLPEAKLRALLNEVDDCGVLVSCRPRGGDDDAE